MDAPPRSQVKGRCHSTVDRRESDQQHLPRSKSAAPAIIMLPAVPANPNAPIVLQSALTVPQSEALLQISSDDRVESPPPEIVMARKVPHAEPQMPTGINATNQVARGINSPISQTTSQPQPPGRKRMIVHAEDVAPKRQKLPQSATSTLTTQTPQHMTVLSSSSANTHGASLLNTLQLSPQQPIISQGSDATLLSRPTKLNQTLQGTSSAAAPYRGTARPQDPNKHWTARTWNARQYHDMADMALRAFPFAEYMRKHNKTEKEVREVFSGVITVPQLLHAQRGVGLARGGLGEDRMKEYRVMEKETMQNIRAEEEQEKRDDEEEERKMKEKPKQEPLCAKCKTGQIAGKPSTIAEAREAKDAAHREFTKALKAYDRIVEKDRKHREEAAKATETSANPTRRPATSK